MTREETIKWLESLKSEIGKSEHRSLWHYAESIDMAIDALQEYEEVKAYADTLVDAFIEDGEELAESVKVVRCKDCRHANECHKSVQYTHNEQSTITIGYTPIEWCSRGERKGGEDE